MSVVNIDMTGLDALAKEFRVTVQTVEAVAQQTVNRGAGRQRTRYAERVRNAVHIDKGDALRQVFVTKVSIRNGEYSAKVLAGKKGLLLSEYDYREQRAGAGVNVLVGRGSGYKNIRYAFVLHAKSGKDVVAFRAPGAERYNTLYGPSASQVIDTTTPEEAQALHAWMSGEINRRLGLAVRPYADTIRG